MCGIAGAIGQHPFDPDRLRPMLGALAKRGPDGSGIWRANRVALLHARLSIIDVAGSPQPMPNEDGQIQVTFNGEIYNYQALRRDLQARGHQLRTAGDTEALVHLYEELGAELVHRLDGIFAFAIYDQRAHKLTLARDRIGIKPLYYWHDSSTGMLVFASDMSAMLAHPDIPRRLNPQALAQYLHFGHAIAPVTWLAGVRQLEPGHTLEWQNGQVRVTRYFAWQYTPDHRLADRRFAQETLNEALGTSVRDQLVSDVPLGSFLSGGLDSTAITAYAQQARQQSGQQIDSFNVRFWLEDFDESPRARAIASDLGTHHTEIDAEQITFDLAFMERLVDGLGEPFADTSALAVYHLCRIARRHVTVALSGDGGDEIFFGYIGQRKQRIARQARRIPAPVRSLLQAMTQDASQTALRRINKTLELARQDDKGLIIEWYRRWSWDDLDSLLTGELCRTLYPDRTHLFPEVRALIADGEAGGFAERQITFHFNVTLPGDGLVKVDRMSMAHGLEVRVPMLSNAMLDYAQLLPLEARFHGDRTKEPLRTLVESQSSTQRIPSPKRGFGFPVHQWIQGNLAEHWRAWELTSALAGIGFASSALTSRIEAFEKAVASGNTYSTRQLGAQLFDLLLLGFWLRTHQVTT